MIYPIYWFLHCNLYIRVQGFQLAYKRLNHKMGFGQHQAIIQHREWEDHTRPVRL